MNFDKKTWKTKQPPAFARGWKVPMFFRLLSFFVRMRPLPKRAWAKHCSTLVLQKRLVSLCKDCLNNLTATLRGYKNIPHGRCVGDESINLVKLILFYKFYNCNSSSIFHFIPLNIVFSIGCKRSVLAGLVCFFSKELNSGDCFHCAGVI